MANSIKIDERAVKSITEKLEQMTQRVNNRGFFTKLGLLIIQKMKGLIGAGISPVAGPGIPTRFPGYKNPDKYPGDKKNPRPVNLQLSGQMLSELRGMVNTNGKEYELEIGYFDSEAEQKNEWNTYATRGQAGPRITIPQGSQQGFAKSIETIILSEFRKELKKQIK